jgi:phosphoribosyl 1,2-cyclic phosphodiesterase
MSLDLCVLGSGSAGNAALVRAGGRVLMIDAGLGPRTAAKRMDGTGVGVGDVEAILLTHLDSDHFKPSWYDTLIRHGIVVYCPVNHIGDLYESIRRYRADAEPKVLHRLGLIREVPDRVFDLPFDDGGAVRIAPIDLTHDREGTVGYILNTGEHRMGYATDLGHVPDALLRAIVDVDMLAIESNYDAELQASSARPWRLKRRVMSDHGHLSNDQALNAIRSVFDRSQRPPAHVVLLHLSRECNDPVLVRDLYADHPRIAERIRLTDQFHRTEWFRVNGECSHTVVELDVMFDPHGERRTA